MADDKNQESDEDKLARAFHKGLKLWQSENEEDQAKRDASGDGDKGGTSDDSGNGSGKSKSLAERLLGGLS